MAKKANKNPLVGRWRITCLDQWDQDYVDEVVQGYFEFDSKGLGSFQFGYVQGGIDHSPTSRDGKPAVEFSWEGGDDADGPPLTGPGWATRERREFSTSCPEGARSEILNQRTLRRSLGTVTSSRLRRTWPEILGQPATTPDATSLVAAALTSGEAG